MSITTYKATLIFGGWAEPSEAEEFFIRLRDAAMSCGYWLQGIDLDCHFENCRISQSPESGWGDRETIRVEPLDEAIKRDKEMESLYSISEDNAKSEQTSVDPHDPADGSQPIG